MRDKIFPFLIALFLLGSLVPTFYELAHRDNLPSIRAFELVHNFPTDYNFYLSRIRQGIEGRVTVVEKYTSEPHRGSFIHVFYLWLGWLGRWVRVPWERGGDVYHAARVVFGALLLVMIAEYCKKAFPKPGKGATEVANENFDPSSVSLTEGLHSFTGRFSRSQSESGQNFVLSPHRPFFMFQRFFSSLLASRFSLLAFLLAVTASTWPTLVAFANNQVMPATLGNIGSWRFGGYMPWWSVMDSLQRITFIPHLLVGQSLIVFLLMAVADEATMKKSANWIFLGILAFVLGIIFPPGLLFVLTAMVVLTFMEFVFDKNHVNLLPTGEKSTWYLQQIIPKVTVLVLGLPALLYIHLMTSFYPWKRLAEFDIIKPLPFDYAEYFKAVGPMLPLGILGLVLALWKRDKRMLTSVAWVLTWTGLLFVFKFIPAQSPLRFSEMIPHVPLAVLTAYLFYSLISRSNWAFFTDVRLTAIRLSSRIRSSLNEVPPIDGSRFGLRNQRRNFNAVQNSSPRAFLRNFFFLVLLALPVLLVLLNLGVMYSSWLWQRDFLNQKIIAGYPLVPTGSYVMYPLKEFIGAMKFIQDNTTRDTVILSETTAGNYIPQYSGNTVFVGHANTVRAEEKEAIVKDFFSGRMKPDDARLFLKRENLQYIFFGPQEKEDSGIRDLQKVYPFLMPVYSNNFVTIFHGLL